MRQYTILLITALMKPWNNGWYYKAGFESNGHRVLCFDPSSTKDAFKKVFEFTKSSKPDFILHTKDELPAEIFQELRNLTRVIQWYPDLTIHPWLPPYVRAADVFITMAEGLVKEFQKDNPNVFWLTQAFEPSFFRIREITSGDRKTFSSEVTFAGTLGSKPYYLLRRRHLTRVMDEGFQLKWWGPRMPRKFSTISLLVGRLGKAYGGKFIWGEEYAKAAQLSKIFLAFDALPNIRKSMSARMYTAVGCGAFYLCQHVEGIEEVLVPGKEIVTFRSEQEMIDMIRYYLKNDKERKRIAETGRERILKDHTYEIRTRDMLRIIEKAL
ncbi:MAG: glycosyltransferase [Thermodesulfovibrionales bacterium]